MAYLSCLQLSWSCTFQKIRMHTVKNFVKNVCPSSRNSCFVAFIRPISTRWTPRILTTSYIYVTWWFKGQVPNKLSSVSRWHSEDSLLTTSAVGLLGVNMSRIDLSQDWNQHHSWLFKMVVLILATQKNSCGSTRVLLTSFCLHNFKPV